MLAGDAGSAAAADGSIQLDGGVLLFTIVISIGVALAFGLLPGTARIETGAARQMHESSGSTGEPYARRLLSGLVVVEVALALVLLVGAGLMTRSFTKLLQVSPGFDSSNLVAARVLLPTTKYQRANQVGFYEEVIERVRREPGVINASAVSAMPLHDVGAAGALPFNVEGQQPPRDRRSDRRRPHRRARLLRDDEDQAARGTVPRRARCGSAARAPA